jgi:exoribonuclease-2
MTDSSSHDRKRLSGIARRAMLARGLLPDFSPAVLAQTEAIAHAALEASSNIRDLRDLLWASIDNDDSRDLDQLSVAIPDLNSAVKILVAIADVDATVTQGSPIDVRAKTNTTSVYTVAEVFPMLPEKLSTDLTSLSEDKDRLAIVIELSVGANAEVTDSDVYRAVVRNRAKLAYNAVAAWLYGVAPAPLTVAALPELAAQLRMQDKVAQGMKKLRHQHGALQLETAEARAVFHEESLVELQPEETNRAKQLIEEFMIAANGATAKYLDRKGLASLRRVLKSPEHWTRIMDLASEFGARLPSQPNVFALDQFLATRREADPTRHADLSLSIIKLLGRGEYAVELPGQTPDGHFGLAVRDYTHSTAPNRRFPDLITQRLLKAALAGRSQPYTNQELQELAQHCTQQEDNAIKVERQVRTSAAALLLQSQIGQSFRGIVTGASAKGTWARIAQPPVEGKIIEGFEGLAVGDSVRIKLVRTDVERGFIDFAKESVPS